MGRNAIAKYISPADHVIMAFGGVINTAKAIGKEPSHVSRWRRPKDRQGHGGEIPRSSQKTILEKAREQSLDITADDLIFGRKENG